jgi:hypothetical protein
LLAKKMGVSDMHAVMAAGFAGGIGLSGGGCGALGAAIWIMTMGRHEEKLGFKALRSRSAEMINAFTQVTGGKIECAQIVGRRFETIADHAAYLRSGNCLRTIEELAASARA